MIRIIILIIAVGIILTVTPCGCRNHPLYPFTEAQELSLRLEALELLEGDPEEIKEEEYFRQLSNRDSRNEIKKSYGERRNNRRNLKTKAHHQRHKHSRDGGAIRHHTTTAI